MGFIAHTEDVRSWAEGWTHERHVPPGAGTRRLMVTHVRGTRIAGTAVAADCGGLALNLLPFFPKNSKGAMRL